MSTITDVHLYLLSSNHLNDILLNVSYQEIGKLQSTQGIHKLANNDFWEGASKQRGERSNRSRDATQIRFLLNFLHHSALLNCRLCSLSNRGLFTYSIIG